MQKFLFNYWLKIKEGFEGYYIGNEACPEYIKKNLDKINELSKKEFYKVLVLPPLFENYFKILDKIKIENFDEITINDFGTYNYISENFDVKINLGRQVIKFKTGNFNEKLLSLIKKEELEDLKEILISDFLLNKLNFNLIELNPIVQGINLKEKFNYSLYWPYILNASTLMCWSNIRDTFFRVENCQTICKKFEGNFLGDSYLLVGNQTLNKNPFEIEEYMKKIKNKEKIKRVVYLEI